jgi:hypothetical protein
MTDGSEAFCRIDHKAERKWQTPNSLVPADYDCFVFTSANDPGLTGSKNGPDAPKCVFADMLSFSTGGVKIAAS